MHLSINFKIVNNDHSLSDVLVYSYFIATRGIVKLLSRGSGEDLVNCCQRPRATVSKIFSTTEGQWFDCSPSSLEITVLLPNCFKSQKHCQQNADAHH